MSIPFRFDDSNTERSRADVLLASLGVTQASLAAAEANRGDASHGTVGIGDAGAPSQNPLSIGPVPGPTFVQPNPAPAPTTTAPPPKTDPMHVTATTNYQQPGTANPQPNPAGTVTRSNPMGL